MNKYKLDEKTGLLTIVEENGTTIVVDLNKLFPSNQYLVGKKEKKPSLLTKVRENWFSVFCFLTVIGMLALIFVAWFVWDEELFVYTLLLMSALSTPIIFGFVGLLDFYSRKENKDK